MDCPQCHEKMQLNKKDISLRRDGKQYQRKIYWCEEDDVWINFEVPLNRNLA